MQHHRKIRPGALVTVAAAAALMALAGCATSTPYQPLSPSNQVSGGYSDEQLAPDRFRVTFAGNTLTSRDKVEGFLLYRAAELTVRQNYDWFVIEEREMTRDVERRMDPDPFYRPWYGDRYLYWRPYWRYYGAVPGWRSWDPYWGDPFWSMQVDQRTVERFEATAEIRMGRGPMPQDSRRAFDARDVLARLGPQVQHPDR